MNNKNNAAVFRNKTPAEGEKTLLCRWQWYFLHFDAHFKTTWISRKQIFTVILISCSTERPQHWATKTILFRTRWYMINAHIKRIMLTVVTDCAESGSSFPSVSALPRHWKQQTTMARFIYLLTVLPSIINVFIPSPWNPQKILSRTRSTHT